MSSAHPLACLPMGNPKNGAFTLVSISIRKGIRSKMAQPYGCEFPTQSMLQGCLLKLLRTTGDAWIFNAGMRGRGWRGLKYGTHRQVDKPSGEVFRFSSSQKIMLGANRTLYFGMPRYVLAKFESCHFAVGSDSLIRRAIPCTFADIKD